MALTNNFQIRKAYSSDIPALQEFFVKAYGAKTIFQSEKYIKWYFNLFDDKENDSEYSVLIHNESNEIVSFYGTLKSSIYIKGEIMSLAWGVNAFTLAEWRGKGLSSMLVDYLVENNESNGVIGFTEKTLRFYESVEYHTFNGERFSRYVYVISPEKVKTVVNHINQDNNKLQDLINLASKKNPSSGKYAITKLNDDVVRTNKFGFGSSDIVTSVRDHSYLSKRFLNNPFINYELYGSVVNNEIQAYVACREEVLLQTAYRVFRIIDLFGKPDQVMEILDFIITLSKEKQYIYVDFSMFGTLYHELLINAGFIFLENDDFCIVPQVTSPIENRPNQEYIGFASKKYFSHVEPLKKSDVYFTRMDSDRDRLGIIDQIAE